MTTWYAIDTISEKPEPVDVESSTDKFVVIDERRHAKLSAWKAYCPTREAAWQWLIAKRRREAETARILYEEAKRTERKVTVAARKDGC